MEIVVEHEVLVRGPAVTGNVLAVAALFGLGLAGEERVRVVERVTIAIPAGGIVLITGPSGSGKSTILRCLERALKSREVEGGARCRVERLEEIAANQDAALVDCFGELALEAALGHLARAGLADAFVLMRRPEELSDGQRFRFRLAQFYAGAAEILLADEFCATLDRVTAKIVAYQLRKFVERSKQEGRARTAIVATTHEDLWEDLRPEVWVRKELGAGVEVTKSEI